MAQAWGNAAEATVVALAAAGDDRAFEELVRRRQSWLRGLLRRLGAGPALADDLAQQVFLQAWRSLGGLRNPAAFAGWLRQIAVNAWRMQHREAGPLLLDLDCPGAQAVPAPDSDPSFGWDLERLLQQVRPEERLCLVLAHAEGMTHPEIAAVTGWPLGTVKSHVLRGMARLRAVAQPQSQEAS